MTERREAERLLTLDQFGVLDSAPEEVCDRLRPVQARASVGNPPIVDLQGVLLGRGYAFFPIRLAALLDPSPMDFAIADLAAA